MVKRENVVNDNRSVYLYYRADGDGTNHIFLGTYGGYEKSLEPRRYIIRFHSIKKVGTTPNNWFNFGNGIQCVMLPKNEYYTIEIVW